MTNTADMSMSSCPIDMKKMPQAGAEPAIDWLRLAATPTFAIMALLTGVLGGGQMSMAGATDASFLTGMVPMYLLMSVFHAGPWLAWIAGRQFPGKLRDRTQRVT